MRAAGDRSPYHFTMFMGIFFLGGGGASRPGARHTFTHATSTTPPRQGRAAPMGAVLAGSGLPLSQPIFLLFDPRSPQHRNDLFRVSHPIVHFSGEFHIHGRAEFWYNMGL